MRRDSGGRPWHLYVLGLLAIGAIVLAVLEIGLPSSGARTAREVVSAQDGVVQSTVTGSGNIAAGTDMSVNFKTSGTLETLNVSVGQHVTEGQLLATLDPTSAQLALNQAEAQLTAAQDQLNAAENGSSTGSGSSAASGSAGSTNSTSYDGTAGTSEYVAYTGNRAPTATTPRRTTTTPTTTTPSTPSGSYGGGSSSGASTSGGGGAAGSSSGSSSRGSSSTGATTTTTTPNPATIASAQASVYSAEASVRSAQQTLSDTRLLAPMSGTISSLSSLVVGDEVSSGNASNGSSSSSSSSSSSGSGGGGFAGGSATAGGLGGSGSSSSSSSGSSSPFAQIVNTDSLTMTVSFSESDVTKVKVGQPATVTLDALPGVELAAHVTQISPVGTTSSSVVSYSATLTLNQNDSSVKPGMSASASVVTGQAEGVTVPNAAVTGAGSLGTVNVLSNGKTTQQQVVVGLRGDSRTQIISGLSAGQQLVVMVTLPSLNQNNTSTTGSSGTLGGGGLGGGGLGGGGGLFRGGGGLGGGGGFFRGGG